MVTLINRVFDGWSWRNLSPEDPFDVPDPDEVEVKRVGNVRVLISKHYTDEFVKDVTRFALEPRTSVVDPIEELLWRWNFDKEEALEDEDHSYWDRKSMRMSLVEAVETLKDRHFDPITIARAVRRYTELLKEPEEFLIE